MYRRNRARLNTRGRPIPSFLYGADAVSGIDLSTYTFSNLAIAHTPNHQRAVFAFVYNSLAGTTVADSFPSVTIGGINATLLAQRAATIINTTTISLFGALVPGGTTATVVSSFSASQRRCGTAIASTIAPSIFPPLSGILFATGANPITGEVLVPHTGLVGVIAADNATASVFTFSGGGVVEVNNTTVEGGTQQGLATLDRSGAVTISSANDAGSSAIWMGW